MTQRLSNESFAINRRGIARHILPVVFASLFLLPVIYFGLGSELARWTQARAQLDLQAGDTSGAIRLMEQALRQSPDDQALKLGLADLLMKNSRASEAMDLIEQSLAAAVDPLPALQAKADCLMHLNRADDALTTVKEMASHMKPSAADHPDRLNQLAYSQALAGRELQPAGRNIDLAMAYLARGFWWTEGQPMPLEDQSLVAAAMVSRSVARREQVLEMLSAKTELLENELNKFDQELAEEVYLQLQDEIPFPGKLELEIGNVTTIIHDLKKFLAILYSVRALLHQDLGQTEACDRDRWSARQLGYDSDELVDRIPDDWNLLTVLEFGAALIDTRAMVRSASGKIRGALADANLAVLAAELLTATGTGSLQNTILDEGGRKFESSETKRLEAVVRQHRAAILARLGQREKAEVDLSRIEELGFERNEILF